MGYILCKYTKQKTGLCFIFVLQIYNMRILIVAATQGEIAPLFNMESSEAWPAGATQPQATPHDLRLLITGVGMVATAFALGRHLAQSQYDLAINLGIAGSFDRNIALGEVVEVTSDIIAELGAEDDESFLSIEQLGFGESIFNASASLSNLFSQGAPADSKLLVKKAVSITVNSVHGNDNAIRKITERLNPQIESMEGAAFFYACKQAGVPCLQIRAVSNYVEKRNRSNWQIGLAIKNLNTFANEFLSSL